VFFIQDAIKFRILSTLSKRSRRAFRMRGLRATTLSGDFVSLMMNNHAHMIMWVMSDRAISDGSVSHDGRLGRGTRSVSSTPRRVAFCAVPLAAAVGIAVPVWDEAVKIYGADPTTPARSVGAITSGSPPEWDLGVQVFDDGLCDGSPTLSSTRRR
jgi:catalase